MKTTQTVQYALMCLQDLDEHCNHGRSAVDVSGHCGIPLPECVEALEKLSIAGLVEKESSGTYFLGQPMEEIKALDVLTAMLAPLPMEPRFKMVVGPNRGKIVRKTLEAVGWAQAMGAYPSENGIA